MLRLKYASIDVCLKRMRNLHSLFLGLLIGAVTALSLSAHAAPYPPAVGGTGTSTPPSFGQLLVGNSSGTYSLTATSSLGLQAPLSLPLSISNGGTALGTFPTYGQLLVGTSGGGYTLTATSSLGINTSQWDNITGGINYAGGKVGVGSTSPLALLSVHSAGSYLPYVFSVGSSTGAGVSSRLFAVRANGLVEANWIAGFGSGLYLNDGTDDTYLDLTTGGDATLQAFSGDVKIFNGGAEGLRVYADGEITLESFNLIRTSGAQVGIGSSSPWGFFAVNPSASLTGTEPIFNVGSSTRTAFTIDNKSHSGFGGFAPTLSSCGSSPSLIRGSDTTGLVRVGTGSVGACTLTFGRAFTNAPQCFVNINRNVATTTVLTASTTPSALLVTASASNLGGTFLSYFCPANAPTN